MDDLGGDAISLVLYGLRAIHGQIPADGEQFEVFYMGLI